MAEFGKPPKGGWAPLVPELYVGRPEDSLGFWCDLLGFAIAYRRPEEGFAYLERHDGPQIMLCARHADWEVARMQRPFGRGAVFQIFITDLDTVIARLKGADWPLFEGPRDVWRRWGDITGGKREVMVQDPDGYLVLLAQDIGTRPVDA
ncbi:MAG: VOC family protein [Aestuariivita sp.]|nr:VOC family protein [Aestuariivita sp.]